MLLCARGQARYGYAHQAQSNLHIYSVLWWTLKFFREIAIFDSDDTFLHSFTNPAFLFPCSIAFNLESKEAFVLGKLFSDIITIQVIRSCFGKVQLLN